MKMLRRLITARTSAGRWLSTGSARADVGGGAQYVQLCTMTPAAPGNTIRRQNGGYLRGLTSGLGHASALQAPSGRPSGRRPRPAMPGGGIGGNAGLCDQLPRQLAERFGVCPAVAPGESIYNGKITGHNDGGVRPQSL